MLRRIFLLLAIPLLPSVMRTHDEFQSVLINLEPPGSYPGSFPASARHILCPDLEGESKMYSAKRKIPQPSRTQRIHTKVAIGRPSGDSSFAAIFQQKDGIHTTNFCFFTPRSINFSAYIRSSGDISCTISNYGRGGPGRLRFGSYVIVSTVDSAGKNFPIKTKARIHMHNLSLSSPAEKHLLHCHIFRGTECLFSSLENNQRMYNLRGIKKKK